MAPLDIEQAARASGLSARDVRLLIERGTLPATRPAGRWLIEAQHLDGADLRPDVTGPIGAAPREDAGTLLAQLEEAQSVIADLRSERDELRLRLREQVSSLQRSLDDSMEELDEARAKVADLESAPVPRSRPLRPVRSDTREALTPLFRASTEKRDVGPAPER